MSERIDSLLHMGLPAAVLQALVPRSPDLAPPPPKRDLNAPAPDVDRYTSGDDGDDDATSGDDQVLVQLRGLAQLHQSQQAARKAA